MEDGETEEEGVSRPETLTATGALPVQEMLRHDTSYELSRLLHR
jgi:hypothetical protein